MLLLVDEPLGSLDSLTRREMQSLVEQLWTESGCTAVLVTDDVEEAVLSSDSILLLEEGQVALDTAVTLPRPRSRYSPEFFDIGRTVLDHLLRTIPQRSETKPA